MVKEKIKSVDLKKMLSNGNISRNTIDEVFKIVTGVRSKEVAMIFKDKQITYDELSFIVHNIALELKEMGLGKGDKVALLLPNCFEYLCLYLGIFMIGAWAVPINNRYTKRELKNVLLDADVSTIIFEDIIGNHNYKEVLDELEGETPLITNRIVRSKKTYEGTRKLSDLFTVRDSIEEDIAKFEYPDIEDNDVALLAYTSGTTGSAKGVMITHSGLVKTSFYAAEDWNLFEKNGAIAFSVAPLYAAQGFLAIFIDFVCGIAMKWTDSFSPNEIISTLSKGDVTIFHTQPTMWSLLLSTSLINFAKLDNLETSIVSGSLCSSQLAARIEEVTKSNVLNGYGLIEATGVVTVTNPDDPVDVRMNTVGHAIPGVELKVVDENREEVPKGEIGELAIKGYLMNGYYKNEEKTKKAIDSDGWLYSGDLARFYDDKNIQIIGRADDMIIRGGFNVFPVDIEDAIEEMNSVQTQAVVGQKDPILSEKIVAFIVPKPGEIITKGQVLKYLKERIADYKLPDEIYFVKQLPTLVSGKVRKNVLKEWAEEGIPEAEVFNFK